MSATVSHTFEAHQQRGHRTLSAGLRRGLALIGAIGVGLLMAGVVLALNNYQAFHAAGEQIDLGTGVSGSYTDTFAADDTYRVVREEYMSGEARTLADNPAAFSGRDTYTDVINFTPYTMTAEGGFIYRIGIHIFEAGDTQISLALYEDTEDVPRLLLAESEPLTVTDVLTPAGWLWFDIEPQLVPADTRYWLAYQATNDDAKLGWRGLLLGDQDGYRFRDWDWGPFPDLAGRTWGPVNYRTCYQIAYTTTQYALDVAYTIPVTPTLDAYTLTVRGVTSGEPFSVTADAQAVGIIPYNPTAQYVFSDDIESGVGGWMANGFMHIVTDSGHYSSPTHVWWTDDVTSSSTASLTSAPITLPFNARNMELRFWHRIVSEFNYDGGWVEYRIQNENGTWPVWSEVTDTMFFQGGYNALLEHVPSGPHRGWTWTITDVVRVRIPVTAAGRAVQWQWVFECDPLGGGGPYQPDGWWIDDVRVLGTVSDDADLFFSVPLSLVDDGEVAVRFQDTITNSYPDLLGIDLIEISGVLYNRPPTVTVTAPNGSEYWSGSQTIEWSGSDPNRDVITYNVYLSTNGGVTWTTSLYQVSYSETEMPAAHSWDGFDTAAFGDSGACLIRIEASDGDANASDQSDAVFTIDSTDPSVTLTAPNGGEVLQGGGSYEVTWSASDDNFDSLPIALYYSTDGGASFPFTMTNATANDGSFSWTVPALDDDDVRVRVVAIDLAGNSGQDDSDANFTVDSTDPSVTLTAPNGGEMLQGGESYEVTWSASDDNFDSLPIALYYSTDGGASFPFTMTNATANDGSFSWTVPALDDDDVRVRVVATDLAGNSGQDDSDADFTIDSTPPDGTVTVAEGDYTLSCAVHLTLDAPDDASEMYLDGDLIDALNVRQWIAYTTAATVTLTAGEGSKMVTVRYRDVAGNEGNLASDTVVYDVTPPTVANETPADESTVTTGTPIISATLADATSGVDSTAITMTVDGNLVAHTYDEGSGAISYTPSSALTNASHVVTLSVQDRAGNAALWTWSFSVNEPPALVLLTADPATIVADGASTATVTATVRSNSGHPVADGTEIVFSTTMGTLAGGAVYTTTTQGGVAIAVLTAPETDGTALITAKTGEVENTIEVSLSPGEFYIYLPIVVKTQAP